MYEDNKVASTSSLCYLVEEYLVKEQDARYAIWMSSFDVTREDFVTIPDYLVTSVDRVFQEFATDLNRFAGREYPLREAAASLRGRQRSIIIMTLGSLSKVWSKTDNLAITRSHPRTKGGRRNKPQPPPRMSG
jgi:sugar/nucleoside kinase (ribokinase family)